MLINIITVKIIINVDSIIALELSKEEHKRKSNNEKGVYF